MQKRKSIGFLLSALGGLLGALLIVLAVSNTVSEWRSFRSTGAAAGVNTAADAILVAVERMTLERGLTNTALNGEAPVAAGASDAIKARRQEMRKAMAAGWPALSRLRPASPTCDPSCHLPPRGRAEGGQRECADKPVIRTARQQRSASGVARIGDLGRAEGAGGVENPG